MTLTNKEKYYQRPEVKAKKKKIEKTVGSKRSRVGTNRR